LRSITEFKLSFGGTVGEELSVYLAGNPLLRSGLQAASRARLALKAARRTG
jgi:hypothetical protein